MPAKRGKQQRDDGAGESRLNSAMRRVNVSERDEARAEQAALQKLAAQRQAQEIAGAAAPAGGDDDDAESWEDVSDENDVDERFDEMDDGEIVDDGDDEEGDEDDEEYAKLAAERKRVQFQNADAGEDDEDDAADDDGAGGGKVGEVWRRDRNRLEEGEKLEYANRAYDCFFQMRSEFPALSFDIVRDHDGSGRTKYPLAMTLAVGSQASDSTANQLYIIRVRNLLRTRHDQGDDEESDDEDVFGDADSSGDDEEDEEAEEVNGGEPIISFQTIRHHGAVNRLRSNPLQPSMLATWSDAGIVQVFDANAEVGIVAEFSNAMREQNVTAEALARRGQQLKFASSSSTAHRNEGYGLDWSRVAANHFASGDCDGRIFVWQPSQGGRWTAVGSTPGSPGRMVEEIQWSPTQQSVFIAGRAGGDVEVWDSRDMKKSKIQYKADATDINVASWNPNQSGSHLLATGADSGIVSIWDLRMVAKPKGQKADPIGTLTFHNGAPITAVEFSEHNESVLTATSDDGQCTVWDLSVERDADEEREVLGQLFNRDDTTALPDQLMFQHQGLVHPKEVHFHPQVPGFVVTGDFNGLHLFKPRNWRSLMK